MCLQKPYVLSALSRVASIERFFEFLFPAKIFDVETTAIEFFKKLNAFVEFQIDIPHFLHEFLNQFYFLGNENHET